MRGFAVLYGLTGEMVGVDLVEKMTDNWLGFVSLG